MTYEEDDLRRLVHEVRHFLAKGDLMTRLATRARLYLEFPDVGRMHHAVRAVKCALSGSLYVASDGEPVRFVDEGTVEIEIGGMSIMLTCKQRFMTPSGRVVGYRNTDFVELPPPGRGAA